MSPNSIPPRGASVLQRLRFAATKPALPNAPIPAGVLRVGLGIVAFLALCLIDVGCAGVSSGANSQLNNTPSTTSISGTISPAANGSGATVTLSGAPSAKTNADASGNFSFTGLGNGSYTITPSKSGFDFGPSSQTVAVNGSNITGISFTAAASSQSNGISGSISPASDGSGATIMLSGAASATTTADASGNYSFTALGNGSYTLSPSKPGFSFSPSAQTATVNGASVTGMNFTAATQSSSGIPASFFGMHVGSGYASEFPLQVGYGEFRNLGSGIAWWSINTCNSPQTSTSCQTNPAANSSFDFSQLDSLLANVKTDGVNDVLFTLAFTPSWASSAPPAGSTCSPTSNSCVLPPDINADGSGANAIWDNWVENIATHVNNSTWLQTHAHIKYWEPWNEVFVDNTINPPSAQDSVIATYAQLLRLTEDTRCLITGTGTIHNFPSADTSTSCSSYLSSLGLATVDSGAQIVMSSGSPHSGQVNQNLLYCNDSPVNDLGSTTSCTWSGGLNWMSNAVDIINFHLYVTDEEPEQDLPSGSVNNWIVKIKNSLSAADQMKPLWNGEGSCGIPANPTFPDHIWNDDYSRAAFVPRYVALLWSAGVKENFWYTYDASCPLWNGSSLTPAGMAWENTYTALLGATPVNNPFCSNVGTIWTCPFVGANGQAAELVWDAQYGPGGTTAPADCTTASNPLICGDTSYTVPAAYGNGWVDIEGTVHPFQVTVTVGAVPILVD
jgi:hypothetical protein